jgi:GNAT superfamily N-acetyltransferase
MHIKQVDPAGDAGDLAAVLPVIQAAHAGFVPGEPVPCGQRVRQWTGKQDGRTSVSFAAFAGSGATATTEATEVVGVTMGGHSADNPDLFGTWTFITPDADGPGIAEALIGRVSEYCRAQGISRLMINTAANADTSLYAPQRGTTPSFVGVRSGLDLSGVDQAAFAGLAAPGPANAGYAVVHWLDACPGDLAEAYAAAGSAMNDAPAEAGDLVNPVRDVERLRAAEAAWMRQGVRVLVTAAVAPDGAVGGFTMVAFYPEQPEFAEVWDTGVARGHRGRGLGARLKATATLRLLNDYPAARGVYTFTARENEHMIAVNRRLGYRDLAAWEMYVHELGARGTSVPRRRRSR